MIEKISNEMIEAEKVEIGLFANTCAKYMALEYDIPVSEELIESDFSDLDDVVNNYKICGLDWYVKKCLDNQFLFERRFFKHVILIRDVLSEISRTESGKLYVCIGNGEVESYGHGSLYFKLAKCYLDLQNPKVIDLVEKLKTGMQVAVMGELEGFRDSKFVLGSCILFEYDDKLVDIYVEEAKNVLEEVTKEYNFEVYKKNKKEKARQEELERIETQRKIKIEQQEALEHQKELDFIRTHLKNVCPKCNKECGKTEKFCRYCGTKLESPYINFLKQILREKLADNVKYNTCYLAPKIPEKIGSNAIAAYASDLRFDDILALYDTTVRKNGKTGMLFSEKYLYSKQFMGKKYKIKYSDIKKIRAEGKNIYITTEDGHTYEFWDHEMKDPEIFCELLNMIVELQKI